MTELHPATSPPVTFGASMAYDPATGNIVLFGGRRLTGSSYIDLADTWTWNGTNWTELHPTTSPPSRFYSSMAYDAATGNVVLFGGEQVGTSSGIPLTDTWTWNGTNWTELHPATSPTARYLAQMAYDPATGNVVLFGGTDGYSKPMWIWNGTNWISQSFKTISNDCWPTMAYDTALEEIVLFGGCGTPLPSTTWGWTGARNRIQLSPSTSPPQDVSLRPWLMTRQPGIWCSLAEALRQAGLPWRHLDLWPEHC